MAWRTQHFSHMYKPVLLGLGEEAIWRVVDASRVRGSPSGGKCQSARTADAPMARAESKRKVCMVISSLEPSFAGLADVVGWSRPQSRDQRLDRTQASLFVSSTDIPPDSRRFRSGRVASRVLVRAVRYEALESLYSPSRLKIPRWRFGFSNTYSKSRRKSAD